VSRWDGALVTAFGWLLLGWPCGLDDDQRL